jgi:hypothetical protein
MVQGHEPIQGQNNSFFSTVKGQAANPDDKTNAVLRS